MTGSERFKSERRRFRWRYDLQRWQWVHNPLYFIRTCPDCSRSFEGAMHKPRCIQCALKRSDWLRAGAGSAHNKVARAVKLGTIPPARDLQCVDCGKDAAVYDHRDYSMPLVVEPVCDSCNRHRGPAKRIPVPHPRYLQ
jgi:hypothetical protein